MLHLSQNCDWEEEAKLLYDKLARKGSSEKEESAKGFEIIADNCISDGDWNIIFLNEALINHSCSPNAFSEFIQKEGETWDQIRPVRTFQKERRLLRFTFVADARKWTKVSQSKRLNLPLRKEKQHDIGTIKNFYFYRC